MGVRIAVLLSAEEHAAVVAARPGISAGAAVRELALAQLGIEPKRKSRALKPGTEPLLREFGGDTVRVPQWWVFAEALEASSNGAFVALDPRTWPTVAFAQWARAAKQWPEIEQWQKLGAYLTAHPPRKPHGFRYGGWLSEDMALAQVRCDGGGMTVHAQSLVAMAQAAKGRFLLPERVAYGNTVRRLLAQRDESRWRRVGEWLAAGGFNWLWEKHGERAATMDHLERWGHAMFERSQSWDGKPLPAPKLNGTSAERAQDASAYTGTSAKELLRGA